MSGGRHRPLHQQGALVQLVRDLVGVVPNIVPFQYNPEQLSRSVKPYNPLDSAQNERGGQAPTVQPFEPQESFTLTLEFDATDGLEMGAVNTVMWGVADRLAALQKLLQPSEGLLGDIVNSMKAFGGEVSREALRPTVPVILFIWGPGRILPVRITSYSVEETQFSPSLYPTQAKVNLGMEVLTPDAFSCRQDVTAKLAIAAYNTTRAHESILAASNIANAVDSIRGLLPF